MCLKASYTVEAALVMGISILVVTACIMLAFTMYHESIDYIQNYHVSDFDPVEKFRMIQIGKDLYESVL